MKKSESITRELREMGSVLADCPRTLPFLVPGGYFDELASVLSRRIGEETRQIQGNGGNLPFSLPEGYFASLPGQILERINAEEGSLLREASRSRPLEPAPEGYFSSFPALLMKRINREAVAESKPHAVGKPVRPRRIFLPSWTWAAAAVLLVFFSLGIFDRFDGGESDPLAMVSREDWTSYALDQVEEWESESWWEDNWDSSPQGVQRWVADLDPGAIEAYLADWEEEDA